jgi:hypothetical protein
MLKRFFGEYTNMIVAICQADQSFPAYVLSSNKGERHFMCCVLALREAGANGGADDLQSLGEGIRGSRRDTVLAQFLDTPIPGLARVVAKITGKPLSAENYLTLVSLMRQPNSRRILRHLPTVRTIHFEALERLPSNLHRAKIVSPIRSADNITAVAVAFEIARRGRPEITPREVARSMEETIGIAEMERGKNSESRGRSGASLAEGYTSTVSEWLVRQISRMTMPEAPWPGNDMIRPIKTVDALQTASRDYENCLDSKVMDVVTGKAYFYEFSGNPRAIVSLEQVSVFGWGVGNIRGRANRAVKPATELEIERAFVEAGFLPRMETSYGEIECLFR